MFAERKKPGYNVGYNVHYGICSTICYKIESFIVQIFVLPLF